MGKKFSESMEMLFSAKWNVPKAALHCGLTWPECMIAFSEYCKSHPPTHDMYGSPLEEAKGEG